MNTMTTVSEVLNDLKLKGYTVDFNLVEIPVKQSQHSAELEPAVAWYGRV